MSKELFFQRINLIKNELQVKKEGNNSFQRYDYFKGEDIYLALNPLFLKHGIFDVFNLEKVDSEHFNASLTLYDTESEKSINYLFTIAVATVKGANPAQNSGATMTYAKRYSYMNAFNIHDSSSDYDTDSYHKKSQKLKDKQVQKVDSKFNNEKTDKKVINKEQINSVAKWLHDKNKKVSQVREFYAISKENYALLEKAYNEIQNNPA